MTGYLFYSCSSYKRIEKPEVSIIVTCMALTPDTTFPACRTILNNHIMALFTITV